MEYNTAKNTQVKEISGNQQLPVREEKQNGSRNTPGGVGIDKIVHDFRSSLNIIIGYSELMLDEVMGQVNEEQRKSLKDILEKSLSLLGLVNDMNVWQDVFEGRRK